MLRTRSLLLTGCAFLALAACSSRAVVYTLTKPNVSQAQEIQDEQLLRGTSGVRNVLPRHDSANTVTLELYLDQDNAVKGLQVATDLGYQRVRN
jgi:hypothetical protein